MIRLLCSHTETDLIYRVTNWNAAQVNPDKVHILKKLIWVVVHRMHSLRRPLQPSSSCLPCQLCLAQQKDQTIPDESGLRGGGRPRLGVGLYHIWGLKEDIWFQDCQLLIYTHACTLEVYLKNSLRITYVPFNFICLSTAAEKSSYIFKFHDSC